jgi:hypothetical protein
MTILDYGISGNDRVLSPKLGYSLERFETPNNKQSITREILNPKRYGERITSPEKSENEMAGD